MLQSLLTNRLQAMRPSLLHYTLAFALAGIGLATDARAQHLTPEDAEALGIETTPDARTAAPAEGAGLQVCVDDVLLVVDAGADGVDIHDPATGDLVIDNFIADPDNLSTPKNAIPNFNGDGIFVIDQVDDGVFEYDCNGAFVGLFAPAGGVNTAILDNAIAIDYSPDGTELWATVTGGANQDAVARFDQSGNYLGNLVANGAGGVDGPFDVLVRASDILVPAINSDNVHQYDHSGNVIGVFEDPASALNFPEQANLASNGNVLVAGFSSPSGVYEYDGATGAEVGVYNVVTGLRGVYELPNGNILVTNSAGLHEITRANTEVRLISDGDQYIELFAVEGGGGCEQDLGATLDNPNPAPGDVMTFAVTVTNNSPDPAPLDLWLVATGPANKTVRLGSGTLPGGATVNRNVRVRVPGNAPQGTYDLDLNLGQFPDDVCDAVSFTVEVSGAAVGGGTAFEALDDFFAASATTAGQPAAVAPNPFARQTAITYEVAAASDVRLSVYDVLGREVAVLVDGRQDAGAHQAVFDASGLAAGTYLYRLVVGSDVQTGRMTLTH